MKSVVCFLASMCACVAFSGEPTLAEPQSVLTADSPAKAAPVAAPATEAAAPACTDCQQPALICVNGRCGSRLYSVQSEQQEYCRNRLFGGHVVRKTQRTVVKPVR